MKTVRERLLAFIGEKQPVGTNRIIANFFAGRPHERQQAWAYLRKLEASGLVVGTLRVDRGGRMTYWRLA